MRATRPKDMEPSEFFGKDEEWLRWKESMGDYIGAVHPGLKQVLRLAAKVNDQIVDLLQMNSNEDEWSLSYKPFVLLKRKTVGEARVWPCVFQETTATKRCEFS